MAIRSLLVALAFGLTTVSCGNPAAPDPQDNTLVFATQTFRDSLAPGEQKFFSFSVDAAGPTDLTLLSLVPVAKALPALTTTMAMSIGTPAGLGCRPLNRVIAQPGLVPQISVPTTPTIYCVNIEDIGNLAESVDFVIRILHP